MSLELTSAFRDGATQAALFRGRLAGGTSDADIERALRFSAPPGYSKHHTGYAVDVADGSARDASFGSTAAYAWLAADDFANAKAAGWVPSYPVDGVRMGPDPEAWELVWVGRGRIACAASDRVEAPDLEPPPLPFCDVVGDLRAGDVFWLADLGVTVGCRPQRFCPDDPITRGEAASLLWRLHGAPEPAGPSPFADVYAGDRFAVAVDWLWDIGAIQGTSPTTFSPDELLDPADAFALGLRLRTVVDRPDPIGLRPPSLEA
ncbi:MAG: D-alanyl-D-alanine carboxypeptidase family protein [Acidimicrobiales bacterium]